MSRLKVRTASFASLAWTAAFSSATGLVSAACATTSVPPDEALITETRPTTTSVEVAELEISGAGVDRFVSCPPPGELGQAWLPPLRPWSPPRRPSEGRDEGESPRVGETALTGARLEVAIGDRKTTTQAITETFPDFRRCHQRGRSIDPTQEGHVAIVLRVGPDGQVAEAEAYGACSISSEVILCMQASAKKLRFDPPGEAGMTVTIPALFASRDGYKQEQPAMNDGYTAAAYVTLEEARPMLHACEANEPVEASATFALSLDARGKVVAAHVDPWSGNQEMLRCAAQAMQSLRFEPPPHGRGSVLTRIVFNPRAGTR